MTAKKKFSQMDSNKIRTFFDDLEGMNKFSKLNIQSLTDQELEDFIKEYPHLLLRDISIIPFQDFTGIYHRYFEMIKSDLGPQKVKSDLVRVQSSLLEKISEVYP